jgi:hypothetical protein
MRTRAVFALGIRIDDDMWIFTQNLQKESFCSIQAPGLRAADNQFLFGAKVMRRLDQERFEHGLRLFILSRQKVLVGEHFGHLLIRKVVCFEDCNGNAKSKACLKEEAVEQELKRFVSDYAAGVVIGSCRRRIKVER